MIEEFNSSPNEFPKQPKEVLTVVEEKKAIEAGTNNENPNIYLNEGSSKPNKSKKSKKSNNSFLMSIASSFAAVAVVAATAIGGVLPSSSAVAEIVEYWTTDTQVFYQLDFEGVEDELIITVENDFTKRETVITGEELLEGSYFGICEDLKPNVEYKVLVQTSATFGKKTIAEQKVRTLRVEDMPKTEFYGVNYECKYETDGAAYFTMDFIDENYNWFNFMATLTDANGTVVMGEVTYDAHEQQVIYYSKNPSDIGCLLGDTAILTITCMSYENDDIQEIILYSAEVNI